MMLAPAPDPDPAAVFPPTRLFVFKVPFAFKIPAAIAAATLIVVYLAEFTICEYLALALIFGSFPPVTTGKYAALGPQGHSGLRFTSFI